MDDIDDSVVSGDIFKPDRNQQHYSTNSHGYRDTVTSSHHAMVDISSNSSLVGRAVEKGCVSLNGRQGVSFSNIDHDFYHTQPQSNRKQSEDAVVESHKLHKYSHSAPVPRDDLTTVHSNSANEMTSNMSVHSGLAMSGTSIPQGAAGLTWNTESGVPPSWNPEPHSSDTGEPWNWTVQQQVAAKMLQYLNSNLREELSARVEDFRDSIDGLVNSHQCQLFYQMLASQHNVPCEETMVSDIAASNKDFQPDQYIPENYNENNTAYYEMAASGGIELTSDTGDSGVVSVDFDKMRCLLKLFKQASIISNTLLHKEFHP